MKLVIALGGNALLRRGQTLSAENQLENIRKAAAQLARVANDHEILLTHGNGPQVGLLALQSAAYTEVESYPLDVLGAQTEGMVGYLLEQELSNLLPSTRTVTTLVTRVEVSESDPAFKHPTKPIGPIYSKDKAELIAKSQNWMIAADGDSFRRVVASPQPTKVLGINAMRWLLEHHAVVIAAGGGGIPVAVGSDGKTLHGVEAVIDKDLCSGLLANEIEADMLLIATDVEAVFIDWKLPTQRPLGKVTPLALSKHKFPPGSMGPKVEAACKFVLASGKKAVIGSLDQIEEMLAGNAGTQICLDGKDTL